LRIADYVRNRGLRMATAGGIEHGVFTGAREAGKLGLKP
jgi:hypothetical protein